MEPAPPQISEAGQDIGYNRQIQPRYPPVMMRRGVEGKVMLRVLVGEDGTPVTIEIEDGSGHREFDQEAKRVVAKYKFNPKKVNGATQQGWVRVPVVFKMEG